MAFHSGIGTHIRGLVFGMDLLRQKGEETPRFTFLGDPTKLHAVSGINELGSVVRCTLPLYSWRERLCFPKSEADLTHFPHYNVLGFLRNTPYVITTHDLTHLLLPEVRLGSWTKLMHGTLLRRSFRCAKRVIVPSECSKRDLILMFGLRDDHIAVIPNAVAPGFGRLPEDEARQLCGDAGIRHDRPYFLSVGMGWTHKNFPFLLREYLAWRKHSVGTVPNLVICGPKGSYLTQLQEYLSGLDADGSVVLAGEQPYATLRALYQRAEALIVPSLYEGFGIPLLEAQSVGVPVICARAGALPETAAESALYFDPRSPQEFADVLTTYMTGGAALRSALVEQGYANERRFTWEKSASLLLQVYVQAMS